MPVDFRDYFWGEANNGFDVLYHNMKHGQVATKELADYFRDRSAIEDSNCKLLAKLSKHANNCSTQGTFAPLWQLLKSSSEKLSSLHFDMVQKFQELIKDINKYYEEQHKKHKQVKEEESTTLEIAQSIKHTTLSFHKAKESYNSKFLEFEKLKRDNGSPKELEKAETKCKKACEDYKNYLDKYGLIRDDFEKKMSKSCQNFQRIEEDHITQMKSFLSSYSEVLENSHSKIERINSEFREQCNLYDVDHLMLQFVSERGTGSQIPGPLAFEEATYISVPSEGQVEIKIEEKTNKKEAGKHALRKSWNSGFLKSRRERRKEKSKKKVRNNKDNSSDQIEDTDSKPSSDQSFQVDDDGYRIRPTQDRENDKDNFYSSSDGESEEEDKEPKIHIEIKPLSNGAPMSASVDELRATIGTITLSPLTQHTNRRVYNSSASTPEDGPIKRSISTSQSMSSVFSPTASSASTPTGIQSPTSIGGTITNDRYAALSELFSEASRTETPTSDITKGSSINGGGSINNGSRGSTPTSLTGPSVIPRPSSQRGFETNSLRGRMSPLINNMTRTESLGSLTSDFKATSVPMGSSRGPSPLTIGISDSIPLAVAFQEVAHAFFKGADETKCQVRLVGDMKISFPAGIVQILANNPSPAQLKFRVNKASKLDHVLPNSQLLTRDTSQSTMEQYVFDFNMPALTSLLRKQYEQSPSASYFNIDILKYQIKTSNGARSTPLHLVGYWKCDASFSDLRIDYKYNPSSLSSITSLNNVTIIVPVDGGVTEMQSKPSANWNSEHNRATWKIPELAHYSDGGGLGTLRARFDLSQGPSTPATLGAQFVCQGSSMSGAEFELIGQGYRVSLVKKQVVSGKYICEPEASI